MPTIYSEGYSAIWEMWAKKPLARRSISAIVAAHYYWGRAGVAVGAASLNEVAKQFNMPKSTIGE